MPNFNDGGEQREAGVVLPDGTFCKVRMKMKRHGYSHPGEDVRDNGLFKLNADTGSVSIEQEYVVVGGRHNGISIYQWNTIAGGSMNDQGQSIAGNISKTFYKAVCDSAYGILPSDMSPNAVAYRSPPAYSLLEGIEFYVRLGIEAGGPKRDGSGNYPDKNFIAHVVVPGEPEYDLLRAGQEVAPKPTGIRQARGVTAATAAPGTGQGNLWGGAPQPAPAAPPQAQGWQQPAGGPPPYQPGQPQAYPPAAYPPQPQPAYPPQGAPVAAPPMGQPAQPVYPPAAAAPPATYPPQGQPATAAPGQPVPNGAFPSNPPAYAPAPGAAVPAEAPSWMRQ